MNEFEDILDAPDGNSVRPEYAGFWLRFVAYIIDSIIVSIPLMVFGMGAFIGADMTSAIEEAPDMSMIGLIVYYASSIIIPWLYYAFMESGNKQATLGKIALGLKVTDLSGGKISFARASGRYFGKIVSTIILFIGFAMAGFTEKKQALHDSMAECLVVRK